MHKLSPPDRDYGIIIFDWDDTLCPSTWLMTVGLVHENMQSQINGCQEYNELCRKHAPTLAKFEESIAAFLVLAKSFGSVYIVTAAQLKWVEQICLWFFPRIATLLQQLRIPVLSARDWYLQRYGQVGTPTIWKQEAFASLCTQLWLDRYQVLMQQQLQAQQHTKMSLVSIGDSSFEHVACKSCVANAPLLISKTLKFIPQPTVLQLQRQVLVAHSIFERLCLHEDHLDVSLVQSPTDDASFGVLTA